MTDYTIFGAGAPSLSLSGDTSPISVSTAFYVIGVSGWRAKGVRIWIPSGTSVTPTGKKAYLWIATSTVPDSILATVDFTGFTAGAWNTAYFSSPVSLIAGRNYFAQVYLSEGGYGFTYFKFTTSATVSVETASLYAAGTLETTPGNGSFVYGAAGLAPATTGVNGSWYGVDVIVDDGAGASGPVDDVGIADHVTAVRTGLPTAVNAIGTATDPMGLTASDTASFVIGGATAFHTIRRTLNDVRVSWGSIATPAIRGPSFLNDAAGAITVGMEFTVWWPVRFVGCNIYKPPNAAGTIPVRLWDRQGVGGTVRELGNATVTWVADSGGWREILFSAPIDLSEDITYTVSWYSPTGDYAGSSYVFYVKPLCAPPIMVPPFSSNTLKGGSAYRMGTAQQIPEINTPTDYYFDPIVEWDSTDPVFKPDPEWSYLDQFVNGRPNHKFVIGVYWIEPAFMAEYAAMGVNSNIAGPGDPPMVAAVKAAGMDHYPEVNPDGDPQRIAIRAVAEDPAYAALVPGYYVIDEPDQYFPYRTPEVIRDWCRDIRRLDSTRPLYIGMGGVVSKNQDNTHQPQGSTMDEVNQLWRDWTTPADILSGDWYNMSPNIDLDGTWGVWTYPAFVRRLRTLNEYRTPIIIAVETTSEAAGYPIPDNVRKAMWACIIEGCNGFELFDHRFGNSIVARDHAHMLHNPPMKSMMTAMIARINSMVDAINSPNTHLVTAVTSSNVTSGPMGGTYGVPMHYTTRADATYEYLIAMGIRPGSTTATFTIPSWAGQTLTVIDESRTVTVSGAGVLTDDFPADYTVHLYRKG